jgi:DNA-binding response OmpR family regulator
VAQALDAGADDYVVKPPRAVELMARVRALLRRRLVVAEASKPLESTAPYQFDAARREVRVADLVVHLTAREFDLIAHLFRHAGLLVARRELETEALRVSPRVQTRTLDTHISRLRRKLVLDGTHGWKLEGVYQRGYRLMNVREDG